MKPNGITAPQGQKECELVPTYNHTTIVINKHSEIKKYHILFTQEIIF